MEINMNNQQFCFIICSNNIQYETECLRYINNLIIPDGFSIDIKVIHNAHSMTQGYNKGMHSSDAKYKIYMHHDVFIINRHLLFDILEQFKNPANGMIGLVGSEKLPKTCIMWNGHRYGCLYSNSIYSSSYNKLELTRSSQKVEAVDGIFIATQYDIPWREDIFHNWDFYDISQSFEFRKAGYNVIIPPMSEPWCFHDNDIPDYTNYYTARKLFMKEYSDMLN